MTIKSRLLTYMRDHVNEVVTIQDLMSAHTDLSDRQITSGMWQLIKETPVAKHGDMNGVWIYSPEKSDDGSQKLSLTVLKETDEYYLATDDEGNVYRVVYLG